MYIQTDKKQKGKNYVTINYSDQPYKTQFQNLINSVTNIVAGRNTCVTASIYQSIDQIKTYY